MLPTAPTAPVVGPPSAASGRRAVPPRTPRTPERPRVGPGLLAAGAAATVSVVVAHALPVSALLVAIALGIAAANIGRLPDALAPGLAVAARHPLRAGIVLLGLQLSLRDVAALGPGVIAVVVAVVASGFAVAQVLGRRLGLAPTQRLLIGAGMSICGAAAVAAVADALDERDARPASRDAACSGGRGPVAALKDSAGLAGDLGRPRVTAVATGPQGDSAGLAGDLDRTQVAALGTAAQGDPAGPVGDGHSIRPDGDWAGPVGGGDSAGPVGDGDSAGPAGDLERDTVTAVALVVLLGTATMALLPVAAGMLGLDPLLAGQWAGASVHEVAQVVAVGGVLGAGALQVAAAVKLARVLLLAPVVAIIGLARRRSAAGTSAASLPGRRPPLVPLFVLGFLAASLVRMTGALPPAALDVAGSVQTVLFAAAMFALGTGVSVARLRAVGRRPVAVAAATTLVVAAVGLAGALLTASMS
ncbi:YeiH family protein [Agilicoccus flavus]|uniref:YeiH family protein n=1 Tax=Agilicoccus flavus TaxID=2775968 RepID=UPI001CF634D6|nr:putative sulfate exporter family transporter [Agilicoccus flavus]